MDKVDTGTEPERVARGRRGDHMHFFPKRVTEAAHAAISLERDGSADNSSLRSPRKPVFGFVRRTGTEYMRRGYKKVTIWEGLPGEIRTIREGVLEWV